MPKKNHVIVGIHTQDRLGDVPNIQGVLSKYGCSIRTWLGLHEVQDDFCSTAGLILLDTAGPRDEIDAMVKALDEIEGVDVKTMEFSHEE